MPHAEDYAARIISEAEALLGQVQQDLDAAAEFYRSRGLNPEKVLSACAPYLGPEQKEELAHIARADQEAIQRDVDEGMAWTGSNPPVSGAARKPRSMV